jgi:hypothetical protein
MLQMFWPFLTILALAISLGVHLCWRRKYQQAEKEADRELQRLR